MSLSTTDKSDPLGVLNSTQSVVERATRVRISATGVRRTAASLAYAGEPTPDWDQALHPQGSSADETANLVLVLDALNFCFWRQGADRPRWQVTYEGAAHNGYDALAVVLRRAVEQGNPLANPAYLRSLTLDQCDEILAGDPGCEPIPLLEARHRNLVEVGTALEERWGGSFLNAIQAANGSATRLIREVVAACPSFDDVASYRGETVRFYKRAQILIADLYGALEGKGPGHFVDMDTLTAFADYKVPQVLRGLGVLEYAPELARTIRRQEIIPPDDEREIEIRAATIWAVELLRRELVKLGSPKDAFEIDWLLWRAGQALPDDTEPYHRTPTIYY